MKKLIIFSAAALVAVVMMSSCNKPKRLAKQTHKTINSTLDGLCDILDAFDKLSESEKQEFIKELGKQDMSDVASHAAKTAVRLQSLAKTLDEEYNISELL